MLGLFYTKTKFGSKVNFVCFYSKGGGGSLSQKRIKGKIIAFLCLFGQKVILLIHIDVGNIYIKKEMFMLENNKSKGSSRLYLSMKYILTNSLLKVSEKSSTNISR